MAHDSFIGLNMSETDEFLSHAEWKWKSNLNPDSRETAEWTNYTEEETRVIEAAWQNKQDSVELKNYRLDLKQRLQINLHDPSRQRPIKRLEYRKRKFCDLLERTAKIGSGGFGTVYRGIYRGSVEVAYKVITRDQLSDAAQVEANILKTLRHPNIVEYIDLIHTPNHTIVVMEYIDGGNLYNYIVTMSHKPDYWRKTRDKMIDVAFALSYLHEKKIIHGDLKSDNVLLRTNGTAVLSDFGLSILINDPQVHNQEQRRGALRWLAPELCSDIASLCSTASDIWAYGCIFIEIVTGNVPWFELKRNEEVVRVLVDESNERKFQEKCQSWQGPQKILKMICACCRWSQHYRPSLDVIIRNLRSITVNDLECQAGSENQTKAKSSRFRPQEPLYDEEAILDNMH